MLHKEFIKFLLALLLVLSSLFLHASGNPADSLIKSTPKFDSTLVYYFHNDFEKFGRLNLTSADTAITGSQNYDPLFRSSRFYATLGNIGSASLLLAPFPFTQSSGFNFGIHTFDNYLFQNDSVRYYKVIKDYTELTYIQGAKKETYFRVLFSRNVYRALNIGFDFRAFNSPGAYQKQRTNQINFYVTAQYFTKDRRYGVIANFLVNRIRNNENGGIQDDSIFTENLEKNRQIISVNLASAVNRVRENGFFMKHYFDLTRHPRSSADTTLVLKKRTELGRLSYSFEYNRQVQNYLDGNPKSGFYENIYLDSLQTTDSINVIRITNEVNWTNPSYNKDKKYRLLQLQARIKQLYSVVSIKETRKYFLQYIPAVDISFHPYSSLLLNAHGDYVLGDYNEGDFQLKANLGQTIGSLKRNAGVIILNGLFQYQKPEWFYEHYEGNNFKWDTSWNKQSIFAGGFAYRFHKIEAGFNMSRINHFVYLDTAAIPQQYNTQFGYLYTYLNEEIDLWKFKFKGQFAYQTVQGTNALRLPAFIGNLTIYFTEELFHKAATLQPGITLFYNSAYAGNGYMPATRSFYQQDNIQIGNYLYMDIFVNVKIQRARIFLMYSHFNSSFMGHEYFMVPHYPMQDAGFKFGLNWNFHD